MHRLQELYNSEINFQISCFWDSGFDCHLGDNLNGFPAVFFADTFEGDVEGLCASAIEHFPESKFAKGNRG